MSKIIQETYHIVDDTLAILPVRHIDYQTIVLERDRQVYIRMAPLEIVKLSCYDEWCTYEGRRKAVMHHMNFKQKIPIPISPQKQIYLFPTNSPSNFDNIWISFKHIIDTKKSSKDRDKSVVIFHNKSKITLNISHYSLRKQINRTFECMIRLEKNF